MSTPNRVRDLLLAAKASTELSIRDIAERAGLSHGTIDNELKGVTRKHPRSDQMVEQLARGFGIPAPRLRAAHLADLGLAPAVPVDAEVDVVSAILADPTLLPEAKAHFLNQYHLLQRITAPASDEEVVEAVDAQLSDLLKAQPEEDKDKPKGKPKRRRPEV